jgi:hypothetical protein
MTLLQGDKLPVAMRAKVLVVGGGWGRERKYRVGQDLLQVVGKGTGLGRRK